MLTPEFMPELWALQSTPQCARSANHQASSHSTDHCLFSLLYGLHSYHYQVLGKRNVPNFPLRVLKQNGYRVAGGSSAALSQWGELSYLTEQFHEFFEAKGAGPVERDHDLLRWSMDFLTTHSEGDPFFLVVFFDSTHHKYYYPPEFEIYKPALAESHSLIGGDEQDADVRNQFVNRYKNSVRFVDSSVGTLLRKFIQLRDGKDWIAAVTGDHGEEFWDHGLLGHASVSFVNARVRVPLVLCTSDKVSLSLALTSHVDIMPTFLDYAGLVPAIDAGDFSSGVSLLRGQDPERLVLVSAMDFPERNRQMAVVSQTSKFLVWKEPSGSKAFRVTSTTDEEDLPAQGSDGARGKALEFLGHTYRRFFVRSH
jgi:membrane-anchored protein YejM (alkaline phosphatase superfamily)